MADQIADRDDFKRFVDGYDGAIRFMNNQIGRLFDRLVDLGVMDDTAIVISADHGEAMGEHGACGDHVRAGEAVHDVPMVIRWPGAASDTSALQMMACSTTSTSTRRCANCWGFRFRPVGTGNPLPPRVGRNGWVGHMSPTWP